MNYEKEKVDHYQKIKKYLCLYYKFNVSKNVQHYKTFWKINEQNTEASKFSSFQFDFIIVFNTQN